MNRRLRHLSLFSGCGGMDIGFSGAFDLHVGLFEEEGGYYWQWASVVCERMRFETVFANDIFKEAREVYIRYFSNNDALHKNEEYWRRIYDGRSIVELVKLHESGEKIFPDNIDIVTGGFPCQDFSVSGKRGGFNSEKNDLGRVRESEEEENRGRLYYWMKRVIDIVRPKMFVAENVKGLLSIEGAVDTIKKDFESGGYFVFEPQLLNAKDYQAPQSRERLIFIGIRKDALLPNVLELLSEDKYNPYPKPTHNPFGWGGRMGCTKAGDMIGFLKEPEDEDEDLSQKAFSKCKWLSKGQGQREIDLNGVAPTIRSEHHGNIEYRRLSLEHGGRYADELAKGMKERRLTVRECATLQTFPLDMEFVIKGMVSASKAYRMIGNAVPPLLAYCIAKRIEDVWPLYFGKE